jgi:signal transduction histidine kinase
VVSNVLGFSQLERRNLAVRTESGDLAAAVREVVERIEPALVRAGATVRVDAPAALAARFDVDALARILGNLLDNAEKYTRDSADRSIVVTVQRRGDAAEVAVADRGPGLPSALRGARFRQFTRGGDDGPPGLGLGLALSQALAQAGGGQLTWRDGAPGATFVLTLPVSERAVVN